MRTNKYLTFGGGFNAGAGLGDLTAQLGTNGGDINQVNWLGVGGETLVGGNLWISSVVVSALGSYTSYSKSEGFKVNSADNKTNIGFAFGTVGNLADGFAAKTMEHYLGIIPGSFDSNVFDFGTNGLFGILGTEATNYTDNQLKKK